MILVIVSFVLGMQLMWFAIENTGNEEVKKHLKSKGFNTFHTLCNVVTVSCLIVAIGIK